MLKGINRLGWITEIASSPWLPDLFIGRWSGLLLAGAVYCLHKCFLWVAGRDVSRLLRGNVRHIPSRDTNDKFHQGTQTFRDCYAAWDNCSRYRFMFFSQARNIAAENAQPNERSGMRSLFFSFFLFSFCGRGRVQRSSLQ